MEGDEINGHGGDKLDEQIRAGLAACALILPCCIYHASHRRQPDGLPHQQHAGLYIQHCCSVTRHLFTEGDCRGSRGPWGCIRKEWMDWLGGNDTGMQCAGPHGPVKARNSGMNTWPSFSGCSCMNEAFISYWGQKVRECLYFFNVLIFTSHIVDRIRSYPTTVRC